VPCPSCGWMSQRQHSWYQRGALDLPRRGATVRVLVRSRRWFCDNPECARRVFAERFDGLLRAGARRTDGATGLLLELGLRAGGEAGARLARKAGLPTSPDTLLRLVRQLGDGAVATPRVLGVDDFALRRGRRYATLLVDLERRRPIDVLPGRETEPLAAWLRAHPGVQVLVRDRAEAYAEAGRRGAPQAQQVADRFHLVQNVGAALDEVARRRRRKVEFIQLEADRAEPTVQPVVPPRPPSTTRQQAAAARARRVARWRAVREDYVRGVGLRAIARQHGMSRNTVRRLVATPEPPQNRPRPARPSGLRSPSLHPFVPYLQARWADGCRNASQLHRELAALGCTTSYSLLTQALVAWRSPEDLPRAGRHRRGQPRVRRTSVRWLCLRPPEQLDEAERAALARVLEQEPELATAHELVQRFRALVRERDLPALGPWLDDAETSELPPFVSFARGVRADYAAVEAAFTTIWSTGPVEGHIHKVKLLKRQGYGRAALPLLRAKILAA
jgi:transposase